MKKISRILIFFTIILGCIGISKNVYAETVLKDRNMTIISGEWNDICAFKYTQGGYYIYIWMQKLKMPLKKVSVHQKI